MKNDNYILIYDDKCPMCAAYTGFFVKTGILTAEGRKNFTSVDETLLQKINAERSKNEIPLIDTATNRVYYGIDALLELLNTKIYGIKIIGSLHPVYWSLKTLYKFISYNRKVITATKCSNGQYDCSPAFNYRWRLIFLFVFLTLNTLALFPVQQYALANSIFSGSPIFEVQLLHAILVSTNLLLSLSLPKQKAFEYLGQVNMLATIVILFLLALTGINKYAFVNPDFNNIYLLGLTVFIFKDYVRRMHYAGTLRLKHITVANLVCIAGFLAVLLLNN